MWCYLTVLVIAIVINFTDSEPQLTDFTRPRLPSKTDKPIVRYHYFAPPPTLGKFTDSNGSPTFIQLSHVHQQYSPLNGPGQFVPAASVETSPAAANQSPFAPNQNPFTPIQTPFTLNQPQLQPNQPPFPPNQSPFTPIATPNEKRVSPSTPIPNPATQLHHTQLLDSVHRNRVNFVEKKFQGTAKATQIAGNEGVHAATNQVYPKHSVFGNPLPNQPQPIVVPNQSLKLVSLQTPNLFNSNLFKPDISIPNNPSTFNQNPDAHGNNIASNYGPPSGNYNAASQSNIFSPNINANSSPNSAAKSALPPSGIQYNLPPRPGNTIKSSFSNSEGNTGAYTIATKNLSSKKNSFGTIGTSTTDHSIGFHVGDGNIGPISAVSTITPHSGTQYNLPPRPGPTVQYSLSSSDGNTGAYTIAKNSFGINNNGNIGSGDINHNPGFYVGGGVIDNSASDRLTGAYLSQAKSGQLDPYSYKQLCGDARPFKRIINTCHSSGQCQKLELRGVEKEGRAQDLVHARSPVVKEKCRQSTSSGKRTKNELVVRENATSDQRPRNRRLIPYTEVILKQYPFN